MPIRKGGISSRERRRIRRSDVQPSTAQPSAPKCGRVVPMTIRYYGRFDVTDIRRGRPWKMHSLDFGNSTIFSGSYAKFRVFKEYQIVHAEFKLTHEVIKTSRWKKANHSDVATFSVASFILNHNEEEVPAMLTSSSWDMVCSHPGVRTTVVVTGANRKTQHIWTPKKASDSRWRLTKEDGLCQLYIMAKKLDQDESSKFGFGHSVSTVIEARLKVQLKGVDIKTTDTVETLGVHPVILSELIDLRTRSESPTYDTDADEAAGPFRPTSPVMDESIASAVSIADEVDESFGKMSI